MEESARSDLDSSSDTARAEDISLLKHQGQCSQLVSSKRAIIICKGLFDNAAHVMLSSSRSMLA